VGFCNVDFRHFFGGVSQRREFKNLFFIVQNNCVDFFSDRAVGVNPGCFLCYVMRLEVISPHHQAAVWLCMEHKIKKAVVIHPQGT
jgi:hypothetical protein